jgi:hypothetical protein
MKRINVEGNNNGFIWATVPAHSWRDWRKPRIVCALAKIGGEYPPEYISKVLWLVLPSSGNVVANMFLCDLCSCLVKICAYIISSVRYFCPILVRIWVPVHRQILIQLSNIKCQKKKRNFIELLHAYVYWRTARQRDTFNMRSGRLRKRPASCSTSTQSDFSWDKAAGTWSWSFACI